MQHDNKGPWKYGRKSTAWITFQICLFHIFQGELYSLLGLMGNSKYIYLREYVFQCLEENRSLLHEEP